MFEKTKKIVAYRDDPEREETEKDVRLKALQIGDIGKEGTGTY
jgi:hypothetical protein